MIPISDDNPASLTPLVNWGIIAICVTVFVFELTQSQASVAMLGFRPASLFQSGTGWGAAGMAILASLFLHAGWLHLGGNMLYLWIFGNNIEDAMGHGRFIVFYLACGFAAALAMALVDPMSQVPMVGASGAISGVLAAYILLYPRARVTVILPLGIIFFPLALRAFWVVGFWFVLQLLSAAFSDPAAPGVAWWAHVGGFLAGLALTPVLKSSRVPYFGPRSDALPRLGPGPGPWGRRE